MTSSPASSPLGLPRLRLNVLTDNVHALEFYRRRGFGIDWQEMRDDGVLGIALHKTGMSLALDA